VTSELNRERMISQIIEAVMYVEAADVVERTLDGFCRGLLRP